MNSADRFKRSLRDREREFQTAVNNCLFVFGTNTSADLIEKVHALLAAGDNLGSLLSQNDHPRWLAAIHHVASEFAQAKTENESRELLKTISSWSSKIAISVDDLRDDDQGVDFDAIYYRLRNAGELTRLFDELTATIERIIATGELDSLVVLAALNKLIAALKANRTGSLAAISSTAFYSRFVFNATCGALRKLPGVGVLTDAWEKTIGEVDESRKNLEASLHAETINAILDESMASKLRGMESGEWPKAIEHLPKR